MCNSSMYNKSSTSIRPENCMIFSKVTFHFINIVVKMKEFLSIVTSCTIVTEGDTFR